MISIPKSFEFTLVCTLALKNLQIAHTHLKLGDHDPSRSGRRTMQPLSKQLDGLCEKREVARRARGRW